MKSLLSIFRVRREERWLALSTVLVFLLLNAMVVYKYVGVFTRFHKYYWPVFINRFHVSGFDPITYYVVTEWDVSYNVYRHPLLAFFMYVPYLLNQALMWLTGMNCVQFIVAALLIAAVMYSVLFIYRIFREVIGLCRMDATLLSAFMYSFAYVMLSYTVPDHFGLSLTMLLLVLWISGVKMQQHKRLTILETVVLFFITAGISLNNGIKVYLANLFCNGKHCFHWRNMLFAILLPAALIWYGARLQYDYIVYPEKQAKKEAVEKKRAELKQRGIDNTASEKRQRTKVKMAESHTGKPIKKGEFWSWTDITTSRWETAVENLFGESIQLHRDYLLCDTLTKRPVIVNYHNPFSYIIEGIIVLLFLAGIWCGRKSKFFWLAMSFFLFDMFIHMAIGFGINEVYIIGAHWLFIIPLAVAYLFRFVRLKWLMPLRLVVLFLTVYLWVYNVYLYGLYLL